MGKPYVAFLWHHHQPLYRDPRRADAPLVLPWVRLHAARDYYQMGHLAGSVAGLRVTFNFTPVLLAQFDDYAVGGRRDRLQELSLREPQRLAAAERDELIAACFDVDFRHAVRNHRRYYKLFRKYARREGFTAAELTDAVVLFNLAWVGEIFRAGPFPLETGAVVDVAPLWEKGGGYRRADVEAVVAAQLDIMRAVVPLHRRLWEEGKVELATTPFYHPILPLLHDTDDAIIDRPGSVHPPRFAYGADARTQLERGLALFEEKFGRRPRGMWPAEGAVGDAVLPYFTAAGMTWLATDEGVLARSGAAGYDVSRPEVLFRPYRVGPDGLAVFFRHRGLSDAIGFVYQYWQDPEHAARDFVKQLGALCAAARRRSVRDCLVTVILDGENAWGAYPRHGVPFLSALYRALAAGDAAQPVTFAEYLAGNPGRDLAPHPPATLDPLDGLACASWIDEVGSLPGNDLGTWVGEPEENAAWALLGAARATWEASSADPARKQAALEHLLAAEGSDWFWWYGDDQGGGADENFDLLFRGHVKAAYEALGVTPPPAVDEPLAPVRVVWRRDRPVTVKPGELLVVEWPTPGVVRFGVNGWQDAREVPLAPAHGVLGRRADLYRASLLRVPPAVRQVQLTFRDEAGDWLGYDFFVPVDAGFDIITPER